MGANKSIVNNFLFPASKSSYTPEQFSNHLAWLPQDGTEEPAVVLLLPYPHARYTILYMHGNGEDLGLIHAFVENLQNRFQVSFCLVEYPGEILEIAPFSRALNHQMHDFVILITWTGYGVAPGSPSEESVNRSVETAFLFLTQTLRIPEDTIVLMGRSIGTGPAIACAARHLNVAGMIVMSGFTSISAMVDKVAGGFVNMFVANRFPSIETIGKVKCPVLFLHGKSDEIIPYTHSGELS